MVQAAVAAALNGSTTAGESVESVIDRALLVPSTRALLRSNVKFKVPASERGQVGNWSSQAGSRMSRGWGATGAEGQGWGHVR
jgi:hypothetical protein